MDKFGREYFKVPIASNSGIKQILHEISDNLETDESVDLLFKHQRFIKEFMSDRYPLRGILIYHEVGSGKTCTSIAVSEVMRKGNYRTTYVLIPAALKNNYQNEIKKCGSRLYRSDQKWKQTTTNWIPSSSGVEYRNLSTENQHKIDKIIDKDISDTYYFINYNGLNHTSIQELLEPNMFDDCTIIIDEAHNFISSCMASNSVLKPLYDLLYKSVQSKIILLSGTPLINQPVEVAYLLNLIHGPINVYKIISDVDSLDDIQNDKHIHVVDFKDGIFEIQLLPQGFINHNGYIMPTEAAASDESRIKSIFERYNFKIIDKLHLSVINPDYFNVVFIDDAGNLKNKDLLQRKCNGSISYYKTGDIIGTPKIEKEIVVMRMSDRQFGEYIEKRYLEWQKEKKNKRFANRVVSRGVCNFVYPNGILRPRVEDYNDKAEYNTVLKNTIDLLKNVSIMDQIHELSPKMNQIVTNINASKGTSIIYSQFKQAEGIDILSVVLEDAGFARVYVKNGKIEINGKSEKRFFIYTSSSDDQLLKCFNNDRSMLDKYDIKTNLYGEFIKLMLITKSGAEGISTKNVQSVHIMEPYWNINRIDQVIGRSRRIASHKELPVSLHYVKVYIYIMTFDSEQREQIMSRTNEKNTTDEFIYNLAVSKSKNIKEILKIMKKMAIEKNIGK